MVTNYEWDPAPPTAVQRVIAGCFTFVLLAAFANWFCDWHLFGGHDKTVAAVLTFVGVLGYRLCMPSVRRL